LTSTAVIGLAAGIPIGVLAICGIIFLAWWRGKQQAQMTNTMGKKTDNVNGGLPPNELEVPPKEFPDKSTVHPPELSSLPPEQRVAELSGY